MTPEVTDGTPGESDGRESSEFAVLVPYVTRGSEECLLLTKRPASLKRYAGQVSFPGGAREPGDTSLEETALREAYEEVGILPAQARITAELSWFETGLGHRVKPFVARIRAEARFRPDPAEVEAILFLPSSRLVPSLFEPRPWPPGAAPSARGCASRPQYRFFLEGHEVWGLTARILRELACGSSADDEAGDGLQ